jgi:hypothetical protein
MRSQSHLTITVLALGILGSFRASGQSLSVGVVAGAGLSNDFRSDYFPAFSGGTATIDYPTPKRYLVGAMIELGLPAPFSLEVDGLYRPLGFTFAGVEPNGTLNSVSPATVVTWEFPVLAKYRFAIGPLKPFVEAGPSFRTAGNLNGTNPSHDGITAGLGLETHFWGLNIVPTLRYTRWAADHETTPDQLELMVEVSRAAESTWRPLGQRFSAGAILGTNLTDYYPSQNLGFNSTIMGPGPASLLAGVMLEAGIGAGFSVEGDALHQPLHIDFQSTINGRETPVEVATNIEWNFPVLAKYRRPMRLATPFAELGPSFRLPQGVTGASHYGVTAGLGVEMRLRLLKIAPGLRYTRWGPESAQAFEAGNLNRVEFLTGFSF